MAKRFTDTEKWKKSWFRDLPPKMKCAWEYLRDMCDHAGIWEADFALMEFMLGCKVTREELEEAFSGRILRLQEGKKYLLLGFLKFQYSTIKSGNRTHESAKLLLKAAAPEIVFESLINYPNPYDTLSIPYTDTSLTPLEISETLSGIFKGDKDTDTDKDKDKDKEKLGLVKDMKRATFYLETP